MDPASTHGLWADLHRSDFKPGDSDFTVIGVPYDGVACARKGAALAPERMRFWSTHLAPFSEDRTRLGALRVCDLGDILIDDQVRDFQHVYKKVSTLPNVPIVLGGDHSISIPVLQAQRARYKERRLGLLWVDA